MLRLLLALSGVVVGAAFAGDLRAPYLVENTLVLPGGVRNPRYIQLLMSPDTRFGESGEREPLGNRLNKVVSWDDILASQSDTAQKNLVESVLNDNNLRSGNGPGRATGVVASIVDVKVPALAVGITDQLTAVIAVPLVRADVQVDTGFIRSADGQRFVNALCEISPDKCNEAAMKLNDATQQKLKRLGYEPIRSQTISGVGDAQVMGKYRWFGDTTNALATKLVVSLPTGTVPNPDRALDVTTGDGRFKAGALLVYERALIGPTRATLVGGYTFMFPQRLVRRLPASDTDSLSADKETLTRKWSETATLGAMVDYSLESWGLVFSTGYQYQYQGKSRYEGAAADAATRARYGFLENLEPAQSLHSVTFAVGFSTVDWYRRQRFPLPFQLNVLYSHPVTGRNVPVAGVLAGELVAFF